MLKGNVSLEVESVLDFYNRVAEQFGKDPSLVRYNCTKIWVSVERFDVILKYYANDIGFAMTWVCYGPKVNEDLDDDMVEIEPEFFMEEEAV